VSGIDTSGIKRVLVIKFRHIGDVLLSAPVFRALKTAIPGVRTTALVLAGTEDMLSLNPNVDEVITFKRGQGIAEDLRLVGRLRAGCFDLAINMTEGDRGVILAFLSGAPYRVGIDPESRGFVGKRMLLTHPVKQVYDGRHRAVIDLDMLGPLGVTESAPIVELYTSQEDDSYIESLLKEHGVGSYTPLAVVHPTSRWLFKCWRDEAVAEVVDYLEGRGIRVALTSGPDARELEKIKNIRAFADSKPIDLSGMLSLKSLASLCKRASLFFGVDTAPMHIAAAVGTPVIALFGPSDYRLWGPLSDKAKVIAKTVEFPCIPCMKDGCGGSKKSRCLDAITVEEAIEAIDESIVRLPHA